MVDAFNCEHRAGIDSESSSKVAACYIDGANGGLEIEVCLGAGGGGFKFIGLRSQAVFKASLCVLLNGSGIFQTGFGCLALTLSVEKPVVRLGNLVNDAAMRVVECKI